MNSVLSFSCSHDDTSDPEFSVSLKKNKKKELDDEDSFNESDDEKVRFFCLMNLCVLF